MAYTTINNPKLFFDVLTWTGDGSTSLEVNGLDFQPDWVWAKLRSHANDHYLVDSVRGVNKKLESDETAAELEDDTYGYLTSFDNDGFSTQKGSGTFYNFNSSADEFVAWCWKTGTSFSNDASATSVGTIDSSGSVNTDAGISIMGYTGNGSNSASFAHGLGVKPQIVLIKNRSTAKNWVYWQDTTGNGTSDIRHILNGDNSNYNNYHVTFGTTTITLGDTDDAWNKSSDNLIAYCFAEKKGYSKFGTYTGNGSTNGPYVHLGFRPAFVMLKKSNATGTWQMMDNKRDTFNVTDQILTADGSGAEFTGTGSGGYIYDFLSSGLKVREDNSYTNASGSTYIYMAFAESPLVNSKGVPCNAR